MKFKENKGVIKWLVRIGKSYKRYIFGFLLINLVTMLISLASAIVGRYVVDAATGFRSELFFRYIIIMLVTTVVSIIISSFSTMFSSYVNEKFAFGIRADMYDRVQRSSWQKLTKFHSADMLSRLSGDIDTVSSSLISIVPNAVVTFVQLVLIVIILINFDPILALIGLIVGPVGLAATVLFRKKYAAYQTKLRESNSEYYAFMQETLSSSAVVKTFQLEGENNKRFQRIRDKRMKLILRSARLNSIMNSLMRLVYSVGYVITFSWCAYNLSSNNAGVYTYGTMTLFLVLVGQLQTSIKSLGSIVPQCYSLVVSSKRIREITELESEEYEVDGPIPRAVGLNAQGVTFTYDGDEAAVLRGLTFNIPPNSRVGIVGTSGAGKTTFIRLLLSLASPDSGSLKYVDEGGKEETASGSSRRFISYVPQGNTLMSGSVRENLRFGKSDATDEEMWQALEIVCAADFIRKTPKGLDTVLTEGAGGLSEGQAQRVAIARALLRNKPVLILDEATSALDEGTEAEIFERISAMNDRTCFIITHRSSMLKYCNMILEIGDDGTATLK
ncbi:MAG: ABC transporter ATP-binding protein [Clostridia bacterium]|nr:ABC transporter ATP-binding protein [Clostridia bacterium]